MKIASIGSSFSAGPGIHPQLNTKARRSGSNFAHLYAKHLDAELVDLSVSGATLLNMLSEPQIANGHTFPPQVEEVPPDADIVLVLGGGNDMHYVTDIIAETWIGWLALQLTKLFGLGGSSRPEPADEQEVYRRYGVLLDTINARAPRAKVVVIEYLTLFGSDATSGNNVPCTIARVRHHQGVAAQLQRATNKAVNERSSWCQIIHAAQNSETHGLGSQDPWVSGLDFSTLMRGEAWVHPNARGMEAVANMLKEWSADGK